METFWTILAYIVAGFTVATFTARRVDNLGDAFLGAVVMMWPVIIPFLVFVGIGKLVEKAVDL